MRYILLLVFFIFNNNSFAQTVSQILSQSFINLSKDSSLKKATVSFCMINIKNGKIIYEKNKGLMLAPASILKVYTTSAALKILGENFTFKTLVTFKGVIKNKIGIGTLYIHGCGDPSLGSTRFKNTKPEIIFKQIQKALLKNGIEKLNGNIVVIKNIFTDDNINKYWLDEDVGNYYGAGVYALNWKENKFEINLVPTKTSFAISSNNAGYDNKKDFCIELKHKDGATTEEAFAYIEKIKPCMYNIKGILTNKNPIQNMQLARLAPDKDFIKELSDFLIKSNIYKQTNILSDKNVEKEINITELTSPPLSQLVYWCNQKSLNLYAEALCKQMAVKLFKKGSWLSGFAAMVQYANSLNVNTKNIIIKDASGLAEENKISTLCFYNEHY